MGFTRSFAMWLEPVDFVPLPGPAACSVELAVTVVAPVEVVVVPQTLPAHSFDFGILVIVAELAEAVAERVAIVEDSRYFAPAGRPVGPAEQPELPVAVVAVNFAVAS